MNKNPQKKSSADQDDSSEVLEFPTDFAEAVAKIQATAAQGGAKKSSVGGKVFRSINDLYLARSR
jgi:hypothetical protein